MKYLAAGCGGPGSASAEGAAETLNNIILPSFSRFLELKIRKRFSMT
ncbi:MAG: hypothetical protein ACN4GW_06170 [Desulforhopalus sp.]